MSFNPIVVIARGNLHLTKRAVASFLAQDIDVTVVLINNASTDGTAAWMATLGDRVRQIHFQSQKSVAECWNYGISWCFQQGADAVFVCNNDVEVLPDAYTKLLAYSTHQHVPFVTCVGVDNKQQVSKFDPLSWSYHVRERPDFSAYLITKECFNLTGTFDEGMKIAYCEDSDYHVRMHRKGIKAVCVDIPFLHHGASTVKLADPEEAERIGKQAELNRERFYAKYGQRIGTPGYDLLFTQETFGIDAPKMVRS